MLSKTTNRQWRRDAPRRTLPKMRETGIPQRVMREPLRHPSATARWRSFRLCQWEISNKGT